MNRLITRGFLPTELPPIFRPSRNLVTALEHATRPKSSLRFVSRPAPYSLARAGTKRCHLTIPNIINYHQLASLIASHWAEINQHYTKSTISLSTPAISENAARAIAFTPMNDLKRHRLLHSAGYRYVLRADVSGFYPSVYTHTITWALHGKSQGKKRSKTPLLGDLIDQLVRDGQDRQSVGLPIGPDTSHIVSEMIGVAIDEIVLASLKKPFSGFRHMDDYYLCFDDQGAAATALTVLTHALRDFELNLNETKTKICPVEEDLESYWSEDIDSAGFSDDIGKQSNDIETFFDKAIRLAKQLSDDNIIKYAVRRSARHVIQGANWKLYEAYLAHVAVSYPSSLPTVCEILSTYRGIGYPLNSDLWKKIAIDGIRIHAPLRHDSEVCWALWLLWEIGATVGDAARVEIEKMNNGVVATMALFLQERGKFTGTIDTRYWERAAGSYPFQGEFWLLAYEGSRRQWVQLKMNALDQFGLASALNKLRVSFLEDNAKLEPIFKKVPRIKVGDASDDEDRVPMEIEGYEYIFSESPSEKFGMEVNRLPVVGSGAG